MADLLMSSHPAAKPGLGVEGLKATADLAKQVITLGSALITATVTFADKFRTGASSVALPPPSTLKAAWVAYLVAVFFAVATLMAVTGSLDQIDRSGAETNPQRSNTRWPGGLMLVSFLVGLTSLRRQGGSQ